jgi:molybdopterin molybdotransferase
MALSWEEARRLVVEETARLAHRPAVEDVALGEALGRVLGADARADRDQPPFDRSTRDGFAVRGADVSGAAEAPARLRVVGEVPAGRVFEGRVGAREAVEIMTGAPLPGGADAVVMVEHTEREVGGGEVLVKRAVGPGDNVVPTGSELGRGAVALAAGRRLDPAAIGLLASLGVARPRVYARPAVSILTTGDEIVPVEATPAPAQIRDSNRHALAAQVTRAGGIARPIGIAPDDPARLEALLGETVAQGDLVLVTGGVSMGKHDHVEGALARLGARVVFDGVAIRPGKPLVFGVVGGKPFFGLPGNPLSTLVTFELFVRPALDRLAGHPAAPPPPLLEARLAAPYGQRAVPLTVFVPAALERAGADTTARPLPSQGSGDLVSMARADALMVVPPGTSSLAAGAPVAVLPK